LRSGVGGSTSSARPKSKGWAASVKCCCGAAGCRAVQQAPSQGNRLTADAAECQMGAQRGGAILDRLGLI
jgi:hypothetical protein